MIPVLALLLLPAAPAFAGHPWGGVDICASRRDVVPPGIDRALLPEGTSPGAQVLQRYCTQCHNLPGPGRHTREEWPAVLTRMQTLITVSRFYRGLLGPVAMPDAGERAALAAYLDAHALQSLPPRAAGLPPDGAERVYREVCGDCHAAPDPRAYAAATWPALLERMDAHRVAMARPPLGAGQREAVAAFGAGARGRPAVAGSGHQGVALPLPQSAPGGGDPRGRRASLAAFFGLAALGVWRWRRGGARR
jgi:cytochrome c5